MVRLIKAFFVGVGAAIAYLALCRWRAKLRRKQFVRPVTPYGPSARMDS